MLLDEITERPVHGFVYSLPMYGKQIGVLQMLQVTKGCYALDLFNVCVSLATVVMT